MNTPFTTPFGTASSPEALGNLGLETLMRVPHQGAAVAGAFTTGILALRDAIKGGDRRPAVVATFVDSLQRLRDIPDGWDIAEALSIALRSEFVLPYVAMLPAIMVLKTYPAFDAAFACAEHGDQAGIVHLLQNDALLGALAHPLLMDLLRSTVISGPELEFILTTARRWFLAKAVRRDAATPLEREFAEALAEQCFLNEYAFYRDAAEECEVANLADAIPAPDAFTIAVVASYHPLSSYSWAEQAPSRLLAQQVSEPAAERALAQNIEELRPVTATVSQVVRALYEENPYPRWVRPYRMPVRETREVYRAKYPGADFTHLDRVETPEILVAGCGTGFNLMMTVGGYKAWRVTAVDLSRASLAHATRHIKALGLPDIRLLHGDILDLDALPGAFDIIEATGVLHHMADPRQGWRILAEKLRPGGLMYVALYSRHARRGIDKVRAFAKARGYAPTRDGIAAFRHDVLGILRTPGHADRPMMEEAGLKTSHDFFSISTCRDLIFHPQEVSLTIPEIAEMIAALGLKFVGFSFPSAGFLNAYRGRFPADPAGANLANWNQFEIENPALFIRMYNFTVQKPL